MPQSVPMCSQSSRGRHTASCRSSSRSSRARSGLEAPTWTWATGRACCSSCGPTWHVPGKRKESHRESPHQLPAAFPLSFQPPLSTWSLFSWVSRHHRKPQRPLPPPSTGPTLPVFEFSACLGPLCKHSSCLPGNAVTSKFILFLTSPQSFSSPGTCPLPVSACAAAPCYPQSGPCCKLGVMRNLG